MGDDIIGDLGRSVAPLVPAGSPVEVAPESLAAFAGSVRRDLEEFYRPRSAAVGERLVGARDGAAVALPEPSFGVHQENALARQIGVAHVEYGLDAEILLKNFDIGLQAIAAVAERIAADYRAADAQAGVDVDRVRGYFHPGGDDGLLDDVMSFRRDAG